MLGPWIKVNWTWSNRSSTTRVNIDILRISEWTWTGRENLIQITIIPTTVGKISWGKMEYPLIVNKKSPKCHTYVWSWRLQNDLGSFPSQNIRQHINPCLSPNQWWWRNWREFYEDLVQFSHSVMSYSSRTNSKKWCPLHHRGLE